MSSELSRTSKSTRTGSRVAFLIDADNLSADVIEQAIAHLLKTFGAIDFRRAYSSPQKVTEHIDLFRRHGIRPMVNVPTGKNSTDIALAVDAIDLAITERPDVIVIGSSDSDYAPLAQRLREKGCRVFGIGQAGKTGSESPLAYDGFMDFSHRRAPVHDPSAAAAPRHVSKPVTGSAPASASAPAPAPAPVAAPAPRSRAQSRRAKPAAAPAPSAGPSWPAEVESILQAMPALRAGAALQLNDVGEALRRHDLLTSKSASPSRFLKRHLSHFELAPLDRPRTVRFLGGA
jgi:hypothetical protein